jgi:hypothetical protein
MRVVLLSHAGVTADICDIRSLPLSYSGEYMSDVTPECDKSTSLISYMSVVTPECDKSTTLVSYMSDITLVCD